MRATLRLAVMALFLIGFGPEFADAQDHAQASVCGSAPISATSNSRRTRHGIRSDRSS